MAQRFRHAGDFQRNGDVIRHRTRVQQVEMLENHAGAQSMLAQTGFIQLCNVAAVDDDAARSGPLQQIQATD
jgi:hypothetical protein